MTIKNRIAKLETTAAPAEPIIVLLNTFYENDDGADGDITGFAVIIWGIGQTENVHRLPGEKSEDWRARIDQAAKIAPDPKKMQSVAPE